MHTCVVFLMMLRQLFETDCSGCHDAFVLENRGKKSFMLLFSCHPRGDTANLFGGTVISLSCLR